MLKVEINEETEKVSIQFSGNLTSAIAGATFIIRDLYEHFKKKDVLGGELFRIGIQGIICDDKSPVWHRDADGIKSVEIKLPDELGDLLKGL